MGVKRKPAAEDPSTPKKRRGRPPRRKPSLETSQDLNEESKLSIYNTSNLSAVSALTIEESGDKSKYASKYVQGVLDQLVDSEAQRAKNPALTRSFLKKLSAKICKQVSEQSASLFQKEDETPEALQARISELEGKIRADILTWREESLAQVKGSGRSVGKVLRPSTEELDTSEIDTKAQEICRKFHLISEEIYALLLNGKDRVRNFDGTLQAVRSNMQGQEGLGSMSSSVRAAQTLQYHVDSSY